MWKQVQVYFSVQLYSFGSWILTHQKWKLMVTSTHSIEKICMIYKMRTRWGANRSHENLSQYWMRELCVDEAAAKAHHGKWIHISLEAWVGKCEWTEWMDWKDRINERRGTAWKNLSEMVRAFSVYNHYQHTQGSCASEYALLITYQKNILMNAERTQKLIRQNCSQWKT